MLLFPISAVKSIENIRVLCASPYVSVEVLNFDYLQSYCVRRKFVQTSRQNTYCFCDCYCGSALPMLGNVNVVPK